MTTKNNSTLALGDSVHDALLADSAEIDPARRYEEETEAVLRRKEQQIDAQSHRRKLFGWLSYAFASEVFAVCSLTLFLPICLEQFARDNGYLLPDRTERCVIATDVDSFTPPPPPSEEIRCAVKIGWLWIDTASFSLYVYSLSVLLQALTVISMGGIADRAEHRKLLLLSFAILGSTATILFIALPSSSPVWLLCAFLSIFAIVAFGASVVAMNAYLPSLARTALEVREKAAIVERLREAGPSTEAEFDTADATTVRDPVLQGAVEAYNEALSKSTSRISSRGIALGYGAGIALLCVALIPVTKWNGSTFSLRLAVSMSGMWWAVFTIPTAIWLPGGAIGSGLGWERTGGHGFRGWRDSSFRNLDDSDDEDEPTVWSQIKAAWIRLGQMLHPREIRKLRNTFWYLGAWFLLSDGFTTITSTAVLFAKTTLMLPPKSLIVIGLLTPMAGIAGSLLWPRLQHAFKLSNKAVLIILVLLASLVPAYGCLGFLPILKGRIGGLTTAGEMYGLAIYFGSLYGAFQAYARALFAELIPMGEEARWYGLFSITDKSSSFLGPLCVGLIADATGNIRYAFFFLFGMILAAVLPLFAVDVSQGREDAEAYDIRS
ncbi:hypothetical protein M408DRAFT_327938 [Serendipita vermifera MAFF 305830]|uniref:Autophagy-related protein n=1 Tax=Serendipita vermifera MAFF 305830 TaxID=933852 RepID=A0A0C2WY89_SERVB|nr:hypothetical protein M408DRAFT_327938 [Serendipita vermifera MAFF 305830]